MAPCIGFETRHSTCQENSRECNVRNIRLLAAQPDFGMHELFENVQVLGNGSFQQFP